MAEGEPSHILVIEESQVLREAMQELLAHEGFHVTAVTGGAGARQILETRAAEFALLVVNLHLSSADQFDVLEWLRAQRARLRIPILAVTGPTHMAGTVERLRGLEAAGVQDTRTLWDQLPYRVRALVSQKEGNQRAAVRMPSGLPVNVRIGQGWTQGTIGNISRSGMFVKVEAPPAPGGQVLLQFIMPDIPRLFEVQARVVWAARRESGASVPGIGVEFVGLDETGSSQLNAFVRMEMEKFGAVPVR